MTVIGTAVKLQVRYDDKELEPNTIQAESRHFEAVQS